MILELICHTLLVVSTSSECYPGIQNSTDASCGPRCVIRVIEQLFNRSPSLAKLIEEMQGEISAGTTFEAVERALTQRGVFCRFVAISVLDFVTWKEPVIVHVDGNHFVVLEAGCGLTAKVWDGLAETQTLIWPTLGWRSSPFVLLTSSRPITESMSYRSCKAYWIVVLVFSLTVLVVEKLRANLTVNAIKRNFPFRFFSALRSQSKENPK